MLIRNDNSGVKSHGVFLLCLCRNKMAENQFIRAYSHQLKAEAIKIKEQATYICLTSVTRAKPKEKMEFPP